MWKHLSLALLVCIASCNEAEEKVIGGADFKEPDFVSVDHILIAVRGTVPGVTRSPDAARKLAYDLLAQIENGGDWATLKQKYSDDKQRGIAGGPYGMTNRGVPRRGAALPRDEMVPAFGNVGFRLEVGEVGMADYTPGERDSKYGYHIIKRVR